MYGSNADEARKKAGADDSTSAFVRVVRMAISGGGCCASRAAVAGSLAAAVQGPPSIPISWIQKTKGAEEVVRLTRDILQKCHPQSEAAVARANDLLNALAPSKDYVPSEQFTKFTDFFGGDDNDDDGACAT